MDDHLNGARRAIAFHTREKTQQSRQDLYEPSSNLPLTAWDFFLFSCLLRNAVGNVLHTEIFS
jgi:hypothetical protein